ncbi:XDD4 family exosortase-dependent surface protein [Planctomycetota bacterium]
MKKTASIVLAAWVVAILASSTNASLITESVYLDSPAQISPVQELNGLSARADFILDTEKPTELKIKLFNTSTSLPGGFDNGAQILTTISFDLAELGYDEHPQIIDGSVVIGDGGYSVNFDNVAQQLLSGADVTGEWGYGNNYGNSMLTNFVTATRSGATAFGGPNLDGPGNLDGPQAGIVTKPPLVGMGGLGAIANSVAITLMLDREIYDLDFVRQNLVMVEFGSDAAFLTTPEPATIVMLGLGAGVFLIKPGRRH